MDTIRNARKITETIAAFALVLPPELQFEPKWTIELPSNCKAFIYDDTYEVREADGTGGFHTVEVKSYRLVVRTRNGRPPRGISVYNNGGHQGNYKKLLDLAFAIEEYARALSKKKTVEQTEEAFD